MPFISETLAQFVHLLRYEEFGLAQMEPTVYNDAGILALSDKVIYEADPDSGYPKYFSGEVIITLNNGRQLLHREAINRGAPDRPIVRDDVVVKFRDNAQMAVSRARAQAILDAVLSADTVRARSHEAALSE